MKNKKGLISDFINGYGIHPSAVCRLPRAVLGDPDG
jgi:hypothetical protein